MRLQRDQHAAHRHGLVRHHAVAVACPGRRPRTHAPLCVGLAEQEALHLDLDRRCVGQAHRHGDACNLHGGHVQHVPPQRTAQRRTHQSRHAPGLVRCMLLILCMTTV